MARYSGTQTNPSRFVKIKPVLPIVTAYVGNGESILVNILKFGFTFLYVFNFTIHFFVTICSVTYVNNKTERCTNRIGDSYFYWNLETVWRVCIHCVG